MVKVALILVLSLLVCQLFFAVDAKFEFVSERCGSSGELNFNYTAGSLYERNLKFLLSNLTSKSFSSQFSNSTIGDTSNKVYGLFQCRNDIGLDVCSACVNNASQVIIELCPLYGEAIVWYFECMLRYSNRHIFSTNEIVPAFFLSGVSYIVEDDRFMPIIFNAMNSVIKNASSGSRYFASEVSNWTLNRQLYTFAQCTPDIGASSCKNCLTKALSNMNRCCNSNLWVTIFLPSCQLRYNASGPFLNDQLAPSASSPAVNKASVTGKNISLNLVILWAIIAGCVVVALIIIAVVWWSCVRGKKVTKANKGVSPASETRSQLVADSIGKMGRLVRYDFATLKTATSDFSAVNVLGRGGFGYVYKGTLENGDNVAIKRLSTTYGQGTKEFMSEVRVLANLQHINLVKLVGYCVKRDEKLLVYEYLLNSSLDHSLFVRNRSASLDWIKRSKIILGIATGLQYLHGTSGEPTVHRDLKPENILLDAEMNPKIADFGLARPTTITKKNGITGDIKGTKGYMALECLRGEYSDKSDVYSFGVIILEIVRGSRTYCHITDEDFKPQIWRLWHEGRHFELSDSNLGDNCPRNDVMRYIQIGLSCLDADPRERPEISSIISQLTSSDPLPKLSVPEMFTSHQQSDSTE